ncbi:UBP1-associated protein 2A [Actinidia rufa]|uniref:UBP1-associated protein 2A n=1 Tax=Actinidia rufa TaxID=165716 RepID=A0A7J0HD05_9ERIC|nr:UBP1-associated protein 2A [Actinidia rufa]
MGKKRKVLCSEPDSSTVTPESEQPQYQAQIETEPEMDPITRRPERDQRRTRITRRRHGRGREWRTRRGLEGSQRRRRFVKSVCDKVSGKSKGYGFILFKHRIGAKKALKEPQKKIGNRMTSCQLASAGPVPAPPPTAPPVSEYTQRKIFVRNVAAEIDPQKLLEFFSKYGEIEDGPLGLDKQTGKPKGFCLFVYKSVESAKKALEEPHKNFEGHTLHCQKAVDGPKPGKPYYQQHHQQYHPHSSRKEKGKYSYGGGAAAGTGHLMAPSGPSMGFNPAGAGLGINNLLGGFGAPTNQGVPPVMNNQGYGNQPGGSYGNQQVMQGGYQNPQMGQGAGRPQPGAGAYIGHGH